ncbi:hypothetical protein [Ligilactobacillus sp. LYQ60]|uniref:hypothetical protein n=1 Tax=Ligilactobacillus sp. LYQ60 TaxID=3378799 RepID=UPI003852EF6D
MGKVKMVLNKIFKRVDESPDISAKQAYIDFWRAGLMPIGRTSVRGFLWGLLTYFGTVFGSLAVLVFAVDGLYLDFLLPFGAVVIFLDELLIVPLANMYFRRLFDIGLNWTAVLGVGLLAIFCWFFWAVIVAVSSSDPFILIIIESVIEMMIFLAFGLFPRDFVKKGETNGR